MVTHAKSFLFFVNYWFSGIGDVFFAAASTYDLETGLILVVMNPNYYKKPNRRANVAVLKSKMFHNRSTVVRSK